jgi:hypothetical protein
VTLVQWLRSTRTSATTTASGSTSTPAGGGVGGASVSRVATEAGPPSPAKTQPKLVSSPDNEPVEFRLERECAESFDRLTRLTTFGSKPQPVSFVDPFNP